MLPISCNKLFNACVGAIILIASHTPAMAATAQGFDVWKQQYAQRALQTGLPADFVQNFVASLVFKPQSIQLDQKQPETTLTLPQYKARTLDQARIQKGRAMLQQHSAELAKASQNYGVAPEIIVALWGKETNYGGYTGNFDIPSVLATLAYEGRRGEFFSQELYKAMKILWAGHVPREAMIGSWAGAMGQCQFMPSSFENWAADGDGDGHKNIWQSLPDVFASTANYLTKNGWQTGAPVVLPIKFPQGALKTKAGIEKPPQTVATWQSQGVQVIDNMNFNANSLPNLPARLYIPDGQTQLAYLVFKNFDVLKHWNRSNFFATTVALWAKDIARY